MRITRLALICATVLALVVARPAAAVTILRDADIEASLRELARPILRAAGLSPARVRILVVQDSALNAFVADSSHIFLNSGLIDRMTTPAMLQAVIAHEAAHIANGHVTSRPGAARNAATAAGLGLLVAAAVAQTGNTRAAGGIAVGAASSAMRSFLGHTRAQEASADQSAARYMRAAGADPQGTVDVFELFRGQEALSAARQDPFMRSHPLSSDRLRAMKAYVAAAGTPPPPDNAAIYWHARARGKLLAFLRAPQWTLRNAAQSPTQDIRLMREAVAWHRRSDLGKALKAIDGAIALRPSDPYLHDLKGEILLKNRQAGAAASAYARAVQLSPNDAQILGGHGRALLAAGQRVQAIAVLEKARTRDFSNGRVLRDLASAYGGSGQPGMASVVTAERYALEGRLDDAAIHAKRAVGLLPNGSGPWQRAQDVLAAAERNR
ncbi:M48 family metalloprotease [Mesobacterium pallidum]|uniref:M48 family metalloprotease n=1 Tax=Mesobacterium pallidum TaxID=2872037 RepID=UPI001EE28433|nr:M48 family metalloprotease [Mesobacterium pallidum]